jgi:hypothetical protein
MTRGNCNEPDLIPAASRRTFLKFGTLGCLASVTALTVSGCATTTRQDSGSMQEVPALDAAELAFFGAVAPAILGLSPAEMSHDNAYKLAAVISEGIGQFGPINQAQFSQLLALLTFAPTRAMVAGIWPDWPNASRESIDEFLDDWRNSNLGLLNAGYSAVTKITASVYYGLPGNREKSGYPGPPEHALKALPQFQTGAAA